jgi:hypothetical protein
MAPVALRGDNTLAALAQQFNDPANRMMQCKKQTFVTEVDGLPQFDKNEVEAYLASNGPWTSDGVVHDALP